MQTKVQKWGNSLALRIPKSFAVEVGLKNNVTVDLALIEGKLVMTPTAPSSFTLDGLLAGVTAANLHREIDSGPATGIDSEIAAIRRELKTLPHYQEETLPVESGIPQKWVNKADLRKQMSALFHSLAVEGKPIGAEVLQKRMGQAKLAKNELSQSILAAREE